MLPGPKSLEFHRMGGKFGAGKTCVASFAGLLVSLLSKRLEFYRKRLACGVVHMVQINRVAGHGYRRGDRTGPGHAASAGYGCRQPVFCFQNLCGLNLIRPVLSALLLSLFESGMSGVALAVAVTSLPRSGVTTIVMVAVWPLSMLPRSQLTGSVVPQVPKLELAEARYCAPVKLSLKVT